ncbi:MAG: DUF3392 family protein [Endozoicomonas sp.]
MRWLGDVIIDLSDLSREHLSLICLALVAVVLVFVGKPIIQWSGRWINRLPVALKLPVRALFNVLVFGALVFYLPGWLEIVFNYFNDFTLFPVLLVVLLLSGVVSERYS